MPLLAAQCSPSYLIKKQNFIISQYDMNVAFFYVHMAEHIKQFYEGFV